jgi:hypothetical protein
MLGSLQGAEDVLQETLLATRGSNEGLEREEFDETVAYPHALDPVTGAAVGHELPPPDKVV